jgi:hypothetical protein
MMIIIMTVKLRSLATLKLKGFKTVRVLSLLGDLIV